MNWISHPDFRVSIIEDLLGTPMLEVAGNVPSKVAALLRQEGFQRQLAGNVFSHFKLLDNTSIPALPNLIQSVAKVATGAELGTIDWSKSYPNLGRRTEARATTPLDLQIMSAFVPVAAPQKASEPALSSTPADDQGEEVRVVFAPPLELEDAIPAIQEALQSAPVPAIPPAAPVLGDKVRKPRKARRDSVKDEAPQTPSGQQDAAEEAEESAKSAVVDEPRVLASGFPEGGTSGADAPSTNNPALVAEVVGGDDDLEAQVAAWGGVGDEAELPDEADKADAVSEVAVSGKESEVGSDGATAAVVQSQVPPQEETEEQAFERKRAEVIAREQAAYDALEAQASADNSNAVRFVDDRTMPAQVYSVELKRERDLQAQRLLVTMSQERQKAEAEGRPFQYTLTPEQKGILLAYTGNVSAVDNNLGFLDPAVSTAFCTMYAEMTRQWKENAIEEMSPQEAVATGLPTTDPTAALPAPAVASINRFASYRFQTEVTSDFAAVMWQLLERAGFNGGKVFIPNSGTGLISAMRPKTDQAVRVTQMPNDPIGFEAARSLFPDEAIVGGLYERAVLPTGYFDAVLGLSTLDTKVSTALDEKLPADRKVTFVRDELLMADPDTPPLNAVEHMILKSLTQLRAGGVGIYVVPAQAFSMVKDERSNSVRTRICQFGEPLSMVRIPAGVVRGVSPYSAFVDGPNSDWRSLNVPMDVIAFAKRPELASRTIAEVDGKTISGYNEPVMDLGVRYEDARGRAPLRDPSELERQVSEAIARALPSVRETLVSTMPEGVIGDNRVAIEASEASSGEAEAETRSSGSLIEGSFHFMNDGIDVGVVRQGVLVFHEAAAREVEIIKGAIRLRGALEAVIEIQLRSDDDDQLLERQSHLTEVYDRFVNAFGPVSIPGNIEVLQSDPALPRMLALEVFDPDSGIATKTSFFTDRVIGRPRLTTRASSPEEALALSMGRRGHVDPELISGLLGKPWDLCRRELRGQIFMDPLEGRWVTRDMYLSGPVRSKLLSARIAAAIDPLFAANVPALESAQPKDVPPGDVLPRLGSPWIPAKDVRNFLLTTFKVPLNETQAFVTYDTQSATWAFHTTAKFKFAEDVVRAWSTKNRSIRDIVNATLNGRSIRVMVNDLKEPGLLPEGEQSLASVVDSEAEEILDEVGEDQVVDAGVADASDGSAGSEKIGRIMLHEETAQCQMLQERLHDQFLQWCYAVPERIERLARIYNQRINAYRERTFSGDYLTFDQLSPLQTPEPHQVAAVGRTIESGNTLIVHPVGSGKTFVYISSAMEQRRMGLAKKICLAVPGVAIYQTAAEAIKFYPTANILVLEGASQRSPHKIREQVSKASMGDWDLVIMSHENYTAIPLSPQAQKALVEREIIEIEKDRVVRGDDVNSRKLGQLRRELQTLQERADREQENNVTGYYFDSIGFDRIFVDEAHNFKNIPIATKLNVPGISSLRSQKALDNQRKLDYMRSINGEGRGVLMGTATPLTNSIAETYVMTRLTDPNTLRSAGLRHFDAWAATFGRVKALIEQKPAGNGWDVRERFIQFQNVPEMTRQARMVWDILDDEDLPRLNARRPALHQYLKISPKNDFERAYLKSLEIRAADLSAKSEHRKYWDKDSVICIMGDLSRGMLDMRLLDPDVPDATDSVLSIGAADCAEIYRQYNDRLGVQAVFLDVGQHGRFSLYQDFKRKLIANGVPENEIAFISEGNTPAKRQAIQNAVNQGKIRVIAGSSMKMGIALNIQKKIVNMIHLDLPMRPDRLVQRIGRGQRQGNENLDIGVRNTVVAKEGYTRRFEILSNKAAAFKLAFRRPDDAERILDDELDVTLEEMQAELTDNSLIKEKVFLESENRNLSLLRRAHQSEIARGSSDLVSAKRSLADLEKKSEIVRECSNLAKLSLQRFDERTVTIYDRLQSIRDEYDSASNARVEVAKNYDSVYQGVIEDYKARRLVVVEEAKQKQAAERAARKKAEKDAAKAARAQAKLEAAEASSPLTAKVESLEVVGDDAGANDAAVERITIDDDGFNFSQDEETSEGRDAEPVTHSFGLDGKMKVTRFGSINDHFDVKQWDQKNPYPQRQLPKEYFDLSAQMDGLKAEYERIEDSVKAIELNGKTHYGMEASVAISNAAQLTMFDRKPVRGSIEGFGFEIHPHPLRDRSGMVSSFNEGAAKIVFVLPDGRLHDTGTTALNTNTIHNFTRLIKALRDMTTAFEEHEHEVGNVKSKIAALEEVVSQPFAREPDFVRVTSRLREIDAELLATQSVDTPETIAAMLEPLRGYRMASGRPLHPDEMAVWNQEQKRQAVVLVGNDNEVPPEPEP